MSFVIPDWEDGKSDSTDFKIKGKKSVKSNCEVNGVSEKSKLNKTLKTKQQIKKNIISKGATKLIKEKNKVTVIKSSLTKQKNKQQKTIPQKFDKPKRKKQEKNSSLMKVDNIDTDKLDEVLLNAKKKKFNEALKKDDVEDVLFGEDKIPEVIKKKHTKHKNVNETINHVNNKSSKLNKIGKAKNAKLKAVNEHIENTRQKEIVRKITPSQKVRQDKKKEKIKLMIKEQTNRNPINFNRNKLRERMLDRLKSAQFRFINEKLYTSSGTEASQLFQNDPAAFQSYHEGYRQQVKKWPVNPLNVIIKRIKKMPKSHLIADMGCGEAELSRLVPQSVRSFDLQQASDQVEVCDMAHTPLLSESMDVVVYCLALMGTDLTAYLLEANRVLKMGGHLLIAEVESRFADVDAFTKDVSRLGFKLAKLNRDHEVFFFLEFVKNQAPPVKKSKLPALTLKPCIYKRR